MEEITSRIKELISAKQLTNAAFADEIGIKRPIISHILSGRNKPSLHVVLQILETYGDVDAYWLLMGKEGPKNAVKTRTQPPMEAETTIENAVSSEPSTVLDKRDQDLPSTLLLIEGDSFRIVKKRA